MSSIDSLLCRQYNRQAYNCCHFAADAWTLLTGDACLHEIDQASLRAGQLRVLFARYRRVPGPTCAPSIVLMDNREGELHIGVCLRRRLLHIRQGGPVFLPFDACAHEYRNFRFYA